MHRWIYFSLLACGIAVASYAHAAEVTDFKDQTIEITVGYGVGGGNDLAARLVARHIGRFIPGNPNVIVDNITGAGGIVQTNFMANSAPKTGLTLGYISRESALHQMANRPGVDFDMAAFQWIGGLTQQGMVAFTRRDKNQGSIEEIKKAGTPVVFGIRAIGGTDFLAGKALEALGVPIKIVSGYGAGRSTLAFEQGEIDSSALTTSAYQERADWVKPGGLATPIVEFGSARIGKTGIPFGPDFKPLPERAGVYSLINQALGLPLGTFAGPPDMSPETTAILSDSFAKMTQDKDFRSDAAKSGIEITPTSGPELKQLFHQFLSADPQAKKQFAALVE